MEDEQQRELRAVGFGFNQPGDITETDIRHQLGSRPRAAYDPRKLWYSTN